MCVEACETRTCLSVSSLFTTASGALTVTSNGADAIPLGVDAVTGHVTLNGTELTAQVDGASGSVTAANAMSLTVTGGSGKNAINLSGVTATGFPSLTSIVIAGGAGNDTIIGSELGDSTC